jgi:hypothetical protein
MYSLILGHLPRNLRTVSGAGRPQPTLCKHGGEAEPAAVAVA